MLVTLDGIDAGTSVKLVHALNAFSKEVSPKSPNDKHFVMLGRNTLAPKPVKLPPTRTVYSPSLA